ncbi:MAG: hypothetical protein NC254_06175 [bacterium]|nr:hypothetical protein [bacterium]
MIDFVVDMFAEIAAFFLAFRVDKVVDKFTKKKSKNAADAGGRQRIRKGER